MRRVALFASVTMLGASTLGGGSAYAFDCAAAPTVDVGVAYVDLRGVAGTYLISAWVYAESNGAVGLQRGSENLFGEFDGDCGPNPSGDLPIV